jgi:hypothetical protein
MSFAGIDPFAGQHEGTSPLFADDPRQQGGHPSRHDHAELGFWKETPGPIRHKDDIAVHEPLETTPNGPPVNCANDDFLAQNDQSRHILEILQKLAGCRLGSRLIAKILQVIARAERPSSPFEQDDTRGLIGKRIRKGRTQIFHEVDADCI